MNGESKKNSTAKSLKQALLVFRLGKRFNGPVLMGCYASPAFRVLQIFSGSSCRYAGQPIKIRSIVILLHALSKLLQFKNENWNYLKLTPILEISLPRFLVFRPVYIHKLSPYSIKLLFASLIILKRHPTFCNTISKAKYRFSLTQLVRSSSTVQRKIVFLL